MRKIIGVISLAGILMSCTGSISIGDKKSSNDNSKNESMIKNNIQLKENGLNVFEAYLVNSNGDNIGEDNSVGMNETISIRLKVEGWKVTDGKVNVGVSEKIATGDGTVVMDKEDIFEGEKGIATAKDAEFITIDAIFKGMKKPIDHFIVSFKVWDKVSNAEVSGSYKLNMKD